MYFTSQLIEFSNHTDICKNMQIVIIPQANPDGYIHSYTNDRMWRKTRKPNPGSTLGCVGTDPNRNFAYKWGGQGASTSACSDSYRGEGPFSESESDTVRNVIASYGQRVKFYVAIHSYGRYLLYPWGYEAFSPAESVKNFERVSKAGYDAAFAHNSARYTVGGAAAALYPVAGGSDDYAYSAGVPIAMTLECAGNSFTPAESQIAPIAKESFAVLVALTREVIKLVDEGEI